MRRFFAGIKIKLDVGDTRPMRPPTVSERVDDAIALVQNELDFGMYNLNAQAPGHNTVTGLASWLP